MFMGQRFFIALLFSSAVLLQAMAVPAKRELKRFMQPDGSYVEARLCGDERLSWFESPNGEKLLKNAEGFITYAVVDDSGDMVSSEIVYGTTESAELYARSYAPQKGSIFFSDAQRESSKAKAPQVSTDMQIFPTEGNCKLLMLLVNFADTEPTRSKEDIESMMNDDGYSGIGSFKEFFELNSSGKLSIDVTVSDWITVTRNHNYFYHGTYSWNGYELVYEALQLADATIDFSEYDNNNDGIVDGIMVLHQGYGQETSGNTYDIWSHSSQLTYMYTNSQLTFDGVLVDTYTIEPELILATSSTINSTVGVFCHEFMHNLGAMDFYDSDYESSGGEFLGTGYWDTLADGCWNGNYGDRPSMVNPFQRIAFGWIPEAIVLDEDTKVDSLVNIVDSQKTYRMNTGDDYDYFLLENRQASSSPFEQGLYTSGLVIYHVNENFYEKYYRANTLNASAEQSVYIVDATVGTNPGTDPSTFGVNYLWYAPYGGSYRGYNPYTLPSPVSWSGEETGIGLYNIFNYTNGIVAFEYMKDLVIQIDSVTTSSSNGRIYMTWHVPSVDITTVSGYNFYINQNGTYTNRGLQSTTSMTLYAAPEGWNEYAVSIVFGNGEVTDLTYFSIYIPQECLLSVNAATQGSSVMVTWTEDETIKAASESNFVEYRVYRNNVLIGSTQGTSFEDTDPTGDVDTYSVKSYWEGDVELTGLSAQLSSGVESTAASGFAINSLVYETSSKSIVCNLSCDYNNAPVTIDVYALDGRCLATRAASCGQGSNTVEVKLNGAGEGLVLVRVASKSAQKDFEETRKVIVR